MLNAYWEPLAFELPQLDQGSKGASLHRHGPDVSRGHLSLRGSTEFQGATYLVQPRSVVLLAQPRF